MSDLLVLDQRPDDIVQEMQISHVFVLVLPREHETFEGVVAGQGGGDRGCGDGDGVLDATPHAAVHHDAVIDVVA